jgi:hypothetical protein
VSEDEEREDSGSLEVVETVGCLGIEGLGCLFSSMTVLAFIVVPLAVK